MLEILTSLMSSASGENGGSAPFSAIFGGPHRADHIAFALGCSAILAALLGVGLSHRRNSVRRVDWVLGAIVLGCSAASLGVIGLNRGEYPHNHALETGTIATILVAMTLVAYCVSGARSRVAKPPLDTAMIATDDCAELVSSAEEDGRSDNAAEQLDQNRALDARDAQLRSIMGTAPDAMVLVDESSVIRGFNAAAEQLWGYSGADALGRDFTDLLTPETVAWYRNTLHHYRATGEYVMAGLPVVGAGVSASARAFPVEIRAGIARSNDEMRLTFFFHDVSGQIEAESRLDELRFDLAHLSRQYAMSALASDLAHELNQPLTASANFVSAARMLHDRGGNEERVGELLIQCSEQTLRASAIIRRMRDFLAKRDVELRCEPLDLLILDTVRMMMIGTRQFDIDLDLDFDPTANAVFVDKVQVQQVLMNLLRNAITALRDQPSTDRRISIRTRKLNEDMSQVEVRDNGPGVPAIILANIGARFTSTRQGEGMGIGLSITRRIVESQGGTLAAENLPDGGALFCFTMRASHAPLPQAII